VNLSDRVIHLFIESGTYCAVCLRCICIYIVESCMFLHWSGYSYRCNSGLRVDLSRAHAVFHCLSAVFERNSHVCSICATYIELNYTS